MSQQPPFRQTINQTVNIRRNPGCLGGCAGLIGVIVLIGIIGVATSNGGATATPRQIGTSAIVATSAPSTPGQPVSPADAAATVAAANRATQGLPPPASATPQVAITSSATPAPQQVVTVKEEAVNLRQSADVASAVVTLVPPGTDATVIGEDETGPDGVTRYIHVRVGDKEGYLRSDLVSAPHVVTLAPPTANAPATAKPPIVTGDRAQALANAIYDGAGGAGGAPVASFYPYIRSFNVQGDTATGYTGLPTDARGKTLGHDLCQAMFAYAEYEDTSIQTVRVYAGDRLTILAFSVKGVNDC